MRTLPPSSYLRAHIFARCSYDRELPLYPDGLQARIHGDQNERNDYLDTERYGRYQMEVRVILLLNAGTASSRVCSSFSHATWSASIIVHSEPSGLRVVAAPNQIQIKADKVDGGTDSSLVIKPDQLLADALPKSINLDEAIGQFVHFEKTWRSCYPGMFAYRLAHPVFNRRGDLLFELLPHSTSTPLVASSDPGAAAARVAPRQGSGSNLQGTRRRRANGA